MDGPHGELIMVGCGRTRGFEMDPSLYTCWPYPTLEGRCLGAYCGWLIPTATAALVLLTVSSVPTMVSVAQTDSGLGQHAHVCDV